MDGLRVIVQCPACGAVAEAHRFGSPTVRLEHVCDTEATRPVEPPYAKGPIHIDRADSRAGIF